MVSGLVRNDGTDECPECGEAVYLTRHNPDGSRIGRCSNGHRWDMNETESDDE